MNPQCDTARLTRRLREQLQEMTAAANVLARTVAGDKNAEGYLSVLNRGICAQLYLVRKLELDMRLNSLDEIRLQCAPVDLVELCSDMMKRVDALVRPSLEIRAEFSTALTALAALADRGALEEMLLCFISNSVRAIGSSGTIRLELARQEDRAVFTLADSGSGMEPAALAGLFDPPEDPETPARGLLLARRIAELHGGTLVAGNAEPSGVRISVSIPIVERVGGVLRSPRARVDESGGWDRALVALSGCLPAGAFAPKEWDK